MADLNGDGTRDLIVAGACATASNCGDGVVDIFLGNGNGSFRTPVIYDSGGSDAKSVVVADVNSDGKPDLIVANLSGGVGVLLGNGDGTFLQAQTYASGGVATISTIIGDVNGDGKPDVIVASECAQAGGYCATNGAVVGVLLGNGDGTFQRVATYNSGGQDTFEAPLIVAIGDVNGDGKADLLLADECTGIGTNNCTSAGVGLLLGNGDGTFQAAVTIGSGGGEALSLAFVDVNQDGKSDLLVANGCVSTSQCATGTISVLLNGGSASVANWAHTWGGSSTDSISATSRELNGDVYFAGSTSTSGAGGQDALILKYDPSGNLLWDRTWGGPSDDHANAVAVDPNGDVYVTGGTHSFGAGSDDMFLLKFDPSGSLLWSETWGGSSYDEGHDISFDSSGNILVAAEAYSYNPANTGHSSATLLKFSPGGTLLWSRVWGAEIPMLQGPTYNGGYSLDVDGNGNILLSGITWDYNVSPNHDSIFVVKFDSSGNFLWNRNWAGPSEDEAWGTKIVRADAAGNVYIAGRTAAQCNSTNFGTCDFDVLVLKLDPNGNFVWSKTWKAGTGYDTATSFDFDPGGNLVITGTKDEFGTTAAPILLRIDPSGNLLSSLTWIGGPGAVGSAVTVDPSGDVFIGGDAPNNTGSWQSFAGILGTETGTLTDQPSNVGIAPFSPIQQTGTVTSPTGIIDTGGGGEDAFVNALPPNYSPPPAGHPVVGVSPSAVNFPNQTVNTASSAMSVTVTNTGTAVLIITGNPSISGTNFSDFSIATGTTCISGAEVSAGSSCVIQLTFTPSAAAAESATLSIFDDAAGSPHIVGLYGTGTVPSLLRPTISSFSPPQSFLGAQVSPFIITGTNFQAGATVAFSGSDISVDSASVTVSPTQIEGNLAVGSEAASGSYSVTVTNPDGGSITSTAALSVLAIPSAPQGLSAVVGNQIVHLHWGNGQSLPEGYNVYINGTLANASGLIENPAFGITGLGNGQLYKFEVTAVVNGNESDRATIFAEPNAFVAPSRPLHPILFLHGINADATAWETTADFLTNTLGWTCGGTLAYSPTDDPTAAAPHPAYPSPTPCDHTFNLSGDYFTTDFGDNLANYKDDPDSRGIFRQGDEVGGFIQALQKRGPLSVVAWSMGGLAARSYIQGPTYVPNQITDLITLGTPHWGVHRASFVIAGGIGSLPPLDKLISVFMPDWPQVVSSQGLKDMDGACVANGDSNDPKTMSSFLQALDASSLLPSGIRYVAVAGIPPAFVYPDDCEPPKLIFTDLVVPITSSTFTHGIPELIRNDNHTVLPTDISAILCTLDPNCLEFRIFSPVDIQVTAPNGSSISNNFTSMPGADYTTVTDASGHTTATVLIPFPQGGQYTIAVTPKPGAQSTDIFTILQTQGGLTTTLAENMQIADIPPNGFQTAVKNGSSFTLNFGGSVQQPLTNDGNGHFVATVTVTNQGNVTVDSTQIAPTNTKLGTSSAISVSGLITRLAPGASATVTVTFPITSALSTATGAPLRITGTYSAGTLSGNWALTFRSVTLGTSIVEEN